MKERTATICVDSENCRLEDLVQAAGELGYVATVRSIVPRNAEPAASVISEN